MSITALPTPPSRTSPATFSANADAFLGALPTFVSEANALGAEIDANAQTAAAGAAAAEAAIAATNSVVWVSGTTYSIGDVRWSPTDYATYRRITAGAGTTDPSADTTNWTPAIIHKMLRSSRTANAILTKADNGSIIDITSGTFSQTFNAASALGNGWSITITNSGTGVITLDPNASETIDGASTLSLLSGDVRIIQSNGTTLSTVLVQRHRIGYTARTSNTQLTAADNGKLIDITSGTFTQTLDAAATLGNGWFCYLRNSGTGTITVDPNASETIDGVASGTLLSGMTIMVICYGSAFYCTRVGVMVRTEVLTSGTSWTAPLGVRTVRVRGVGAGGGLDNTMGSRCGGGYFEGTYPVTPGVSYAYMVGAGVAGTTGGTTTMTIGATTLTGGGGSDFPGTSSGGQINISGGYYNFSGHGGNSMLGMGGVNSLYPAGYGYGSSSTAENNVAGGNGVIILEY